jgi:hypothetical protein
MQLQIEMVPNEHNFNCNHWIVYQKLGPKWTSTHDGAMHDGWCTDKKHTCPIIVMMDNTARN